MQLTEIEKDVVKRLVVGGTPEQILHYARTYLKEGYPETKEEILAIKQKALATREWFTIFNEEANKHKRRKGAL